MTPEGTLARIEGSLAGEVRVLKEVIQLTRTAYGFRDVFALE